MLNGKFFTGLPPKMIDKGGAGRNRQESHFFWPDDSQVDTVHETRLKRRTSFQSEDAPVRPQLGRQWSLCDNEVDTKQRFQKEFAKSSIQFFDNLQAPEGGFKTRNKSTAKIAEKPTAMKIPLPEDTDDDFASLKKQQTFASKIKFYDFIDERPERELQQRNNLRKMDVNDKRELEKNSKNSPKLQSKKEIGSLLNERARENQTPDKDFERQSFSTSRNTYEEEQIEEKPKQSRGQLYDKETFVRSYENDLDSQGIDLERRNNEYREDSFEKDSNSSYREMANYEREEQKRSFRARSEDPNQNFRRNLRNSPTTKSNQEPRYFVKRGDQRDYRDYEHLKDYRAIPDEHDFHSNESLNQRQRRSTASPQKHVHYEDESYGMEHLSTSYENEALNRHLNSKQSFNSSNLRKSPSPSFSSRASTATTKAVANKATINKILPNMKAGNNQRQQQSFHNNHRSKRNENDLDDLEQMNVSQYMETSYELKNSLNNRNRKTNKNNNIISSGSSNSMNNIRNSNNNYHNQKIVNNQKLENENDESIGRKKLANVPSNPSITSSMERTMIHNKVISPANNSSVSTAGEANVPKHLRSSLCFNDGAIIADATMTPTSQQQPRRNARSSATQRVSVGLPD